jgi:hypothetical protein
MENTTKITKTEAANILSLGGLTTSYSGATKKLFVKGNITTEHRHLIDSLQERANGFTIEVPAKPIKKRAPRKAA